MKNKKIILLILIISVVSCQKDTKQIIAVDVNKINVELKNKLEFILIKDQGIREIINGNISEQRKSELLTKMKLKNTDIEGDKKFSLMNEIDNQNIIEVEKIIKEFGYPEKSLVGEPANKAAFYVIQHSDKIDKYLPLMRQATKNGEISKTALAMMEDRNLMYKGQKQIYGTQIKGQANKEGDWVFFLWPLQDANSINRLRKEAGFSQTIEEYLKEMNVEYKFYKLNELKDI